MKLFQLMTFVDQKQLDALKAELLQLPKTSILKEVFGDMLDPANIEELDDELTFSDDSRTHGFHDGSPE